MTATAKTATEAYAASCAEAIRLLHMTAERFRAHRRDQAADPRNWGYVGDMDQWNTLLRQLAGVSA